MLERNKIALIQVARQQLGLSDDDYRAILNRIAGVSGSRDLDDAGFSALMLHFNGLGFESTSKKRNFGDRRGMASAAQVAKIRSQWQRFTEGTGTDATLGKWLASRFKVNSVRFVTASVATKVIGALTTMNSRKAEL